MKMVVFGAQAPKCENKPLKPTQTSSVGTMVGQVASGIKVEKGARKEQKVHRQHFAGLLHAPKMYNDYMTVQNATTSIDVTDSIGGIDGDGSKFTEGSQKE